MTTNISRFPVPKFEELDKDLQEVFKATEEKLGFIPNVFKGLSHRPAELRAFLAYNEALMNKESGLTPAEKELLIIAHSNYNGCIYCVASHGAAHRAITGDKIKAEQVAVNYVEADVTAREKAIIDFAMKVTKTPGEVESEDIKELEQHGLNAEDAWDIAGITAFFNLSNRMMSFVGIKADEEFYSMGR